MRVNQVTRVDTVVPDSLSPGGVGHGQYALNNPVARVNTNEDSAAFLRIGASCVRDNVLKLISR